MDFYVDSVEFGSKLVQTAIENFGRIGEFIKITLVARIINFAIANNFKNILNKDVL